MAKAAMAALYVDPAARFVNDLITSEIEVSDSLLSRVWPSFSAADLLFDPDMDDDGEDLDAFEACDGEDDDVEIEFEADEDEGGFFANLDSWPRKKG